MKQLSWFSKFAMSLVSILKFKTVPRSTYFSLGDHKPICDAYRKKLLIIIRKKKMLTICDRKSVRRNFGPFARKVQL